MKQNRNRIIPLAAAALLLAAGCTKEAEQGNDAAYSDVQILAASELPQDNVVVVPQSKTRAAADPTQEMTFYLVRADETGKGTGIYGTYGTTPLVATRAAGAGSQALTFATKQYYFASNAKTRLTGWYPAATSLTGSVVSWTIDGATDILTAAEQTGNMSNAIPNLVFNHGLAQVQIHAYAPDANAGDTWGTISKIELMEQTNTCTYDFSANAATGAVTPQTANKGTFTVGNLASAAIPVATAAQVGDPVMIVPQTTAAGLKLEVTTSKCGKVEVLMPAGVYLASKAYILKLKFNAFTIDVAASIGVWQTVDRSEQEVPPSVLPPIGALKDGGIVYEVTDAKNYKVFSLTEGSNLKWSDRNYVLGAGDGQDVTDGKKNMSAIKAYFDANPGTVGSYFAVAFPAAGFCDAMNTGGVTGWYLPARDELMALYTVYTANKVVLDKAITDNSGTAMSASSVFLSGTESSLDNSRAWTVNFFDSSTNFSLKTEGRYHFVRCVKSITPPPAIGDLKDGGIVYEVTDAKNYKVFSLTEGVDLAWSAASSYILGAGDGQDLNDGKKNMSAIKAYFAANPGTVGSDFSVAFPAAAYCERMNTGGVSGWYLPAVNELVALYTAYTANKVVLDNALTDHRGTAMSSSGEFWSGTEYSSNSSNAWSVNFRVGDKDFRRKTYLRSVRCVRDL